MISMIEMRDEELKFLIDEIAAEVNASKDNDISEDETYQAIQNNWTMANQTSDGVALTSNRKGREIFEKIRTFVCNRVQNDDTKIEKIIKIVLDAIALIMPAGLVAKALVVLVVRLIINLGINQFCQTNNI